MGDGGLSFTFFLYVTFFVISEDVMFFLLDLVTVLDSVFTLDEDDKLDDFPLSA